VTMRLRAGAGLGPSVTGAPDLVQVAADRHRVEGERGIATPAKIPGPRRPAEVSSSNYAQSPIPPAP